MILDGVVIGFRYEPVGAHCCRISRSAATSRRHQRELRAAWREIPLPFGGRL